MNSLIHRPPDKIPGTYGWPILGLVAGLLDFFLVRGWTRFFTDRRSRLNSDIFKVNLFQPTIAVLDAQAIASLFQEDGIAQDHGFSWAVPNPALVGHILPSIFASGQDHDKYKSLYILMLQLRAKTLISTFEQVSTEFGQRWSSRRSFDFETELEDFAVTFLFKWYFNINPDAPRLRKLYLGLFSHVFAPITKFLPWSSYRRSLTTFEDLLAQLKRSDGLKELLALAHELDLPDDDLTAKQLLFVAGMNSFLGIQNLLKSMVGELSARRELVDTLRDEIEAARDSQPDTQFAHLLARLPLLDRTLREILRLHPPVTFVFGRLQSDRELHTLDDRVYQVHRGELLMGVLPLAMRDARLFPRPDEFETQRYLDPSAGEWLIWPRGHQDGRVSAHDRTCPGKDVSLWIMKLMCAWLLPNFRWTLDEPAQWDTERFTLNVAAPVGSMHTSDFETR